MTTLFLALGLLGVAFSRLGASESAGDGDHVGGGGGGGGATDYTVTFLSMGQY